MSDVMYRCCEHCHRTEGGVCTDAPNGTDTHEIPCDQGGPHIGCPECDCDPCDGVKRVTP